MALLFITPIGYTPEMVPKSAELLIYLNPLSYFIIGFHEDIVFGQVPSPLVLAGISGLGLARWTTGYWVFCRVRKVFFDYA